MFFASQSSAAATADYGLNTPCPRVHQSSDLFFIGSFVVNSSDSTNKEGHVRLTTVPYSTLSSQIVEDIITFLLKCL